MAGDGPVDWNFAKSIGSKIANRKPVERTAQYASLEADFEKFTAQAEELVAAETGLRSQSGAARGRVADRDMWIAANVASFQRLLSPIIKRLGDGSGSGLMANVGGKVSGGEVGLILGWMSTRVLGQYDLLIIEDENPEDQDIVYYVGPNIVALEQKHNFPPEEFRLWLALHEVTHRAQFTGVPWLREHFLSLVNQTLDAVDPDPGRLKDAAKKIIEARKTGEDVLADGLPALLATPEQRAVLNQISGMMSLLEGHGDVTMDRAGAGLIPSAERFARTLRARRGSSKGVAKFLQRLIGIEAKLNQYQDGEDFIAAVEAAGGTTLLDRAWEGPENLPSQDEIKSPQLWIDRMSTGVIAAS